ncbi:MAG: tRNA preQ1(34) S-adenosylmethionine ribosyltransferase-isomerase QueA [Alphaproteobacteria bacterium]|nr:tRNA preQ1(34) S-adenosylmethionine ribosyltransferase-isomerase QueA [Alphaproteobacteria bacterium]
MKVADFDFALPTELIAQHPARPRDSARLLEVGTALADRRISDLPRALRAGDLLVYNDTRVIRARLGGRRGTAAVEVTLHKRLPVEAGALWRAFARPAKKLKAGDTIEFAPEFAALVTDKRDAGEVTLRFPFGGAEFYAALERHGHMPLPPYIKRTRGGDPQDEADYQTVWGEEPGAVAASTAGLHFTEPLLAALADAGIGRVALTLHIGAGTFLPVKADDTAQHVMHAEWGEITAEAARAIDAARARGGRIVAVGTTALRLLETVAAATGRVQAWSGETDIFIVPGFQFRAVDMLLTNFHLPRSTLFMLVSAFAGLERMRAAYAHAIAKRYRFYSYGDACLLHRADQLR